MAKIYKLINIEYTRLYIKYSLVFFLAASFAACKHSGQKITLVWKEQRDTGIQIPKSLINDGSEIRVAISGRKSKILGEIIHDGDIIVFKPLIPLSPGFSYDILQNDKIIGNIKVSLDTSAPPQLIAIYPENDTLPENTLKLYLRFSKPMRTGQSLNYICLLDKNKDTMRNVFLNLQPELWDTSGTVLTVWLDPGRIKRGLVLNRKFGNPLKKAEKYQLIIQPQWRDTRGINLSKKYTKQFITGDRTSKAVDINAWQLSMPKAGTTQPLIINTKESLDHYLLQESIAVVDAGTAMKGSITVSDKDRLWKFTPSSPWKVQSYKLKVKANLEDLAGNNVNRVFDRDITKDVKKDVAYMERVFEIKN